MKANDVLIYQCSYHFFMLRMNEYKQDLEEDFYDRIAMFENNLNRTREFQDPNALSPMNSNSEQENDHLQEEEEESSEPPELYATKPLAIEVLDDDSFETFCHFTQPQFDYLWDKVKKCFPIHRGRQPQIDPKNQFFLLLHYCSSYQPLKKIAIVAHLETSVLFRNIQSAAEKTYKRLLEIFVKKRESTRQFDNYPEAVGACDVSLIPIHSSKNHKIEEKYYSTKHKRHGIKLQAIVDPDGICIDAKCGYPGSMHDLRVFRVAKTLERFIHERTIGNRRCDSYYPLLFDKGYVGVDKDNYPEAIVLKKNPRGQKLQPKEKGKNDSIEHDRIIVENYFGRLKTLWPVTQIGFRGNPEILRIFTLICVGLTNYYNLLHPMREHVNVKLHPTATSEVALESSTSSSDETSTSEKGKKKVIVSDFESGSESEFDDQESQSESDLIGLGERISTEDVESYSDEASEYSVDSPESSD